MKRWMAWWWGWSSILKVLKVTSLQCLDNISKNKLWLEFILVFIKIKTSTSWIINFWLKQTCPKYPKRKFVKLLQYIKKKYCNCFTFYYDAKHLDTLQGPSHVCYYLFLQTFQLSQFCQVSPSLWYAVPAFRIESNCTGFYISHQKIFIFTKFFISSVKQYIYSELYL